MAKNPKTKRNQADLTLRNLRALKPRVAYLETLTKVHEQRIDRLEATIDKLVLSAAKA